MFTGEELMIDKIELCCPECGLRMLVMRDLDSVREFDGDDDLFDDDGDRIPSHVFDRVRGCVSGNDADSDALFTCPSCGRIRRVKSWLEHNKKNDKMPCRNKINVRFECCQLLLRMEHDKALVPRCPWCDREDLAVLVP